ncbi:MAG: phosphoenolpyruvate carboxylase, partial [Atopobium sp.]|nr:phosphoenolpyruvate carboxylase [Atopobium sp.]
MAGNPQDSNLESSNASVDEKPIDGATTPEVAQSLLERRGNEIAAARTLIQALKAPAPLRDNLTFFLRLVRKVLAEYNPDLLTSFDTLLVEAIKAGPDDLSTTRAPLLLEAINAVLKVDSEKESLNAFLRFASTIDNLSMEDSVLLMRAFVTFFHLANLCEENYRVTSLRSREASVDPSSAEDPINEITVAYRQLIDECGEEEAKARLN